MSRSRGVDASPPVSPVVIPVSKGNRSWTMTGFPSAAEYLLLSQIQKWGFTLFLLNGSSRTWVWKEWSSMVRATQPKGENSWLQGRIRFAPLLHCLGLFSALQLRPSRGSYNTSLQLWAEKSNLSQGACSFFLKQPSQAMENWGWGWTVKEAESTKMQKCRVKPFCRVKFGTAPWKNL